MSKRKELLLKLKKYVQEGKNEQFAYAVKKQGEEGLCFCSVGFLMNECGFDFDQRDFIEKHNTNYFYTIESSFDFGELTELITPLELTCIQNLNDEGNNEGLINYIDRVLEDEK